jgi:hypothetical protein
MPRPYSKETKSDFMNRCIEYLVSKENRSQEQAIAICAKYWEDSKAIK